MQRLPQIVLVILIQFVAQHRWVFLWRNLPTDLETLNMLSNIWTDHSKSTGTFQASCVASSTSTLARRWPTTLTASEWTRKIISSELCVLFLCRRLSDSIYYWCRAHVCIVHWEFSTHYFTLLSLYCVAPDIAAVSEVRRWRSCTTRASFPLCCSRASRASWNKEMAACHSRWEDAMKSFCVKNYAHIKNSSRETCQHISTTLSNTSTRWCPMWTTQACWSSILSHGDRFFDKTLACCSPTRIYPSLWCRTNILFGRKSGARQRWVLICHRRHVD